MADRRRVAVVTDSTSDLTAEHREENGITVVPLNVHFGDEVFRDQIDITTDEFMQRLETASRLPTTSQPSVGVFEETFRTLAESFDEIVCVLISERLSGTVQSAQLAAEAVAEVIPVEVVDSLNATYGLGFQAIHAAELARNGLSAAEIADQLRAQVSSYHVVFFVETLEHLHRGGRIGKAAQLIGSLLQLKPLLRIDEGQVVPFERTRTRAKALDELVNFAQNMANVDRIAALYNTTPEDLDTIIPALASQASDRNIARVQFGPVLATHVGPGVVGLAIKERLSG